MNIRVGLLHEEDLNLLVLEDSTADVILGRPWLVQHNLILSWESGEVLKGGESCFPDCFPDMPRPPKKTPAPLKICTTSIESPVEKQSVFFVAKKDGGLRPCIDYRALNKIRDYVPVSSSPRLH